MAFLDEEQMGRLMRPIFRQLGRCISSLHFQVSERALSVLQSEVCSRFLSQQRNASVLYPIIYPALQRQIQYHWNNAICQQASKVLEELTSMSPSVTMECVSGLRVSAMDGCVRERERE